MGITMVKKFSYLNTRLVSILRTKPGTPAKNAIQAIQTAFDSGVEAVEITSNSDFWQEIVSECVKRNLNIGVGSIKDESTANEAINRGAKFLVSPGLFESAIAIASKYNIHILPGVYTEAQVVRASELGIVDQKFFPASVKTHSEIYKAIREPFRDEFLELENKGWKLVEFSKTLDSIQCVLISTPTDFYKEYLYLKNKKPSSQIVISLPKGEVGFNRLKQIVNKSNDLGIRTYAVGGVNDKNIKEVLTTYGAYGVCPGSGMFSGDAILNGDFEKVKADVKKHVAISKEVLKNQEV